MKCNIDEKGRRVRRAGGTVCCVVGAALVAVFLAARYGYFLTAHYGYPVLFVGLGLLAGGAFQLYEARKGWCALRAMGIKTKV